MVGPVITLLLQNSASHVAALASMMLDKSPPKQDCCMCGCRFEVAFAPCGCSCRCAVQPVSTAVVACSST
jgi:hypothetical protein